MYERNQWSLDLETLSTKSNAVILSVGLAQFDPERNEIMRGHEFVLNVEVQRDEYQRHISDSTVAWWGKQSAAAQEILAKAADCSDDVDGTLREIAEVMGKEPIVWGNGSDFDNVILRSLFEDADQKCPWHFRANRDMRTINGVAQLVWPKLHPEQFAYVGPLPHREGVHHNALDDAIYQAKIIMRFQRALFALGGEVDV